MIEIKDLSKTFKTHYTEVKALEDINLQISTGDIFGIIGFSGAGKSTLTRCINRLEEPDKGKIIINGLDLMFLEQKELRIARQKIGMIFQQFNLLDAKNIYHNIAFPLEVSGYNKKKIKDRVHEILELVNLKDKEKAYPSQLSGGQKQRVGIARALVNHPEVLLSDEATSSLDPQTTYSILELLKDINKKLGLTIVLITHELDVLKHICNNMAVIEHGKIAEKGSVEKFFLNPESDTSRRFVNILKSFQSKKFFASGEGI